MVIQRWQSLLLFIAAVCMTIYCFTPFATLTDPATGECLSTVRPSNFIVYLVLNITIAALMFIAIFLFKNLKRQISVSRISMLLTATSAVTGSIIAYNLLDGYHLNICGLTLQIVAFIATLWADKRIVSDRKLLASIDRIR